MNDFDETMAAVAEEYAADPAGVTVGLIEEASRDQFERLQPVIDEVVNAQRQQVWEANLTEAHQAMNKLYGEDWGGAKQAVAAYITERPELIPDEIMSDPQRLAEHMQMLYRHVRHSVDAETATAEWTTIKDSYRSYSDPIKGRDYQ